MISEMGNQGKWRKILYEDQGVADNYVDESFLDEMKKNLYTRTYDYWTVVHGSGVVSQQISCVCLFVMLFMYMDTGRLSPQTLSLISTILTVTGYVVNELLLKIYGATTNRTVWADTKTVILFLGLSYGLSPILMTLTQTISTDTIYAMTFFMLLTHLLFHDYGATAAMVSQSMSLNAAIFASVCLASRLSTRWHAFATITCAVEIFALGPVLRKNFKKYLPRSQLIMTVTLAVTSLIAIATVSHVGAILFLLLHIFVTFVCSAWLIKIQPFKNNIHGPWDEAVIKE